MDSKKVLCFSGGLDSLIGYFVLKPDIVLYFRFGHKYEKNELHCIKKLCKKISGLKKKLRIINNIKLGEYEKGENAYIKFRNLIIATIATQYGKDIAICGVKGDNVSDKSPEAFKEMTKCLNFISKKEDNIVKIYSPFWKYTKTDLVRWGIKNIPNAIELFKTSISCYDNKILGSCGKCKSCFRKFVSLTYNEIDCKNWFKSDITKNPYIKKYIKRIKNNELEKERAQEIIVVLKKIGRWS